MNVLLIDDDTECLESLSNALQLNGFKVQTSQSPTEALTLFNPETTDLVITDFHLPDMTGIEILRYIHKIKQETPVIIVSGDHKRQIRVKSLKGGAYGFFYKPLNINKIITRLKDFTNNVDLID